MKDKASFPFSLLKKLKDRKNSSLLLVILGISGILLIFLSQLFEGDGAKKRGITEKTENSAQYEDALKQKLEDFVSSIDKAGKVKVLICFDDEGESFYLKENASAADSSKETYVITDSSEGRSAVITSKRYPKIKGVSILCEGGDNAVLKATVTEAVAVALGLSYSNVYVSKIAS